MAEALSKRQRRLKALDLEAFVRRLHQIVGSESQASFARRADISQATLSELLTGKTVPSVDVTIGIANAGHVTLDWLITGVEASTEASHGGVTAGASLNLPVLCKVITTLEGWLAETEGEMTSENKASAILKIYEYVIDDAGEDAENVQPKDIRKLLRLIS